MCLDAVSSTWVYVGISGTHLAAGHGCAADGRGPFVVLAVHAA